MRPPGGYCRAFTVSISIQMGLMMAVVVEFQKGKTKHCGDAVLFL